MSSTATAGALRLNTATITQYLSSRTSLADSLAGVDGVERQVVLIRSTPEWDGPAQPCWAEGRTARIAVAPSPLAVHELVLDHLAGRIPGPAVLVVLSDREENELDPAVLARVHRRRVVTVDRWDVVREAFGAEQVDTRLRTAGWAAEALLDATPPGGWPPLAGGMLTKRDALAMLALRRLSLGRFAGDRVVPRPGDDRLDAHSLLGWSLRDGGPDLLLALRGPERDGLVAFLGEEDQAGLAGRAVLALVEAGHGADAVAYGLVCAALWQHADSRAETYQAQGRAERWFGEWPSALGDQFDTVVTVFGEAAETYVIGLLAAGDQPGTGDGEEVRESRRACAAVLDRATKLARQFGAGTAVAASPVMREGLDRLFSAVGTALTTGSPSTIAKAVATLSEHRLASAPDARARINRARMGQRLAQWLAGASDGEPGSVDSGIERHMRDTAWVDMALEHVEAGGDPDPVLKAAYDALGTRIRDRRREIDRAFARTLAGWTVAGTPAGALLTVETFLDRVVKPVVKHGRRVLLVVVDGMSAAIASELADEIRESWSEFDPLDGGPPRRRAMAAALPTLTAVSRTSLFAGTLMKGTQADEERLFSAHEFWGGAPAAVFHKDDLRTETSGDAFGPRLNDAIQNGRTHVAVVLNTVDDRLAKEQKLGDGSWRMDEVAGLRDLVRAAGTWEMALIVTSDHGHVVDRHGAKIDAAGAASARHRIPGGLVADNEIELSGPRVVWPAPGASIVALWDADSHYTALQAGYHGGASLAEVTIPVLAFLPFGAEPPAGWRELGDSQPAWWSRNARDDKPDRPVSRSVSRTKKKAPQRPTGPALFEVPSPATLDTEPHTSPEQGLIAALMASDTYQAQIGGLARKLRQDEVERALKALLDAGGTLPVTALAQRVGLPSVRGDGFAARLRQVLNYDGVQVLETLPDGRTLRLNTELLRLQFGLA